MQKLSLRISGYKESQRESLINSICENGSTLQVLDISKSRLMSFQLKLIIEKCIELRELNLANVTIFLKDGSVDDSFANYFAKNLTRKIEKLSIGGTFGGIMEFNQDENFKTLVSRCTKILAFNLGLTEVTADSLNSIIDHLGPTLEELSLNISDEKLIKLKVIMPRLKKLLNQNNTYTSSNCYHLRKGQPSTTVNEKDIFVATNISPENGIWEIETKVTLR